MISDGDRTTGCQRSCNSRGSGCRGHEGYRGQGHEGYRGHVFVRYFPGHTRGTGVNEGHRGHVFVCYFPRLDSPGRQGYRGHVFVCYFPRGTGVTSSFVTSRDSTHRVVRYGVTSLFVGPGVGTGITSSFVASLG
jgi:hypothetical protein